MPEVTITYKKPETLKILKGLAKYFDFKINVRSKESTLLDDILVPADKSADISELRSVFTGKDIDAKKLREQLWQRKK
ncbi:hypothetical protein [Mucilaginibacter pedocola]|uniref:Uncharacterized protein n=1 Tax=Mucilaginibacter pedocola TaxID=1792845 RepID=A0A1S9PAP1_9SPHI|nr:hypothetical protein [Mucilaginibacter pedocola]OOQ58053.1 hypothetical protein BC343_10345 [Mucilaginibacter pedocola]